MPSPPPQPHPVSGLPLPLGFRGSPTTQPHPGVNTEPFETSKAQAGLSEGGECGGREQEYDFGQEGAPQPPLLGGAPLTCSPRCCHPPLRRLLLQQPPSRNPLGCRIP